MVIDPQQLNLYPYARNNPLRFTDPTGEIINEPTGLSREDQERYDKWKAAYVSTASGQATWKKYQDDQDFTLNILVADRGNELANKHILDNQSAPREVQSNHGENSHSVFVAINGADNSQSCPGYMRN
jgi:hypothetical protein